MHLKKDVTLVTWVDPQRAFVKVSPDGLLIKLRMTMNDVGGTMYNISFQQKNNS